MRKKLYKKFQKLPVPLPIPRSRFCNFGKISTAQKMKFSIKYFFSKCDKIRRFPSPITLFTYFRDIYNTEFELKIEHQGSHASFLNLDIAINEGIFSMSYFIKETHFYFPLCECLILITTSRKISFIPP